MRRSIKSRAGFRPISGKRLSAEKISYHAYWPSRFQIHDQTSNKRIHQAIEWHIGNSIQRVFAFLLSLRPVISVTTNHHGPLLGISPLDQIGDAHPALLTSHRPQ